MTTIGNRTYSPTRIIYENDYMGRELDGAEGVSKDNVVKDFNLGATRIKICDDYCRDKTPEAVQVTLERIAQRAQEQLAIQETLSNENH